MADNDNTFLNANNIYEEVEGEVGKNLLLEETQQSNLVGLIKDRFQTAEDARQTDETRWLNAYENYRGLYSRSVKFRASEKSRVFVKITKTKVLAAFGQLVDVMFGTGKFPIGISETILPEGEKENAYLDINNPTPSIEQPDNIGNRMEDEPQENPYDVGYEGDGRVLKPGVSFGDGYFEESEINQAEEEGKLTEGLVPTPQIAEVSPAQKAARKMEKLIHDQIEESNGSSEIRNALLESALLGTGIMKGPFNFNKKLNKWDVTEEGEREYNPLEVRVPRIEFVSCWDFYPDPAATNMEECEFAIHRHKMNRSQLRQLRNMPYFDEEAIRTCLRMGANYVEKDFETQLKDDEKAGEEYQANFEVLEYWGLMDAEYAREVGIEVSEEIDDLDEVQINAWVCGTKILRAVINPFTPYRIPYHAFPYERNPYNFFGIGIAENMSDSQQVMNGHARMAIDNLALSGSVIFDVDESALVGGQSMEVYPGKIFRRQAGMPGQAIHGLKFPNTSNENMMMFDKFRQLADEQTGLPSYSHGQTGVQSMTRTASGMSMLLGAASLNIKTVVKNLDDFLLKPLGEAYFQWNMQFFEGELDVKGDLEVKATGTNSLMQKEVRSQRLTTFLQTAQNPAVAPFVKVSKLISELAYSLDLDPDEILNDPEEAAMMAQIIGMQNARQETSAETQPAGQQPSMDSNGGVSQSPQDLGVTGTGGGNIGTGNIPQPGESEFSGSVNPTTSIS
jgi:hypothetical protein